MFLKRDSKHYADQDQTVCDSLDCGHDRHPLVLARRFIRTAEQLTYDRGKGDAVPSTNNGSLELNSTDGFDESCGSGRNQSCIQLSLIHISEPTRLLSISYAVFCLKKKKKQ